MSFRAKYDGRCKECGEAFEAGDLLDMTDDGAVHVSCEEYEGAALVQRPTCPKCWQEQAANGQCGCDPE